MFAGDFADDPVWGRKFSAHLRENPKAASSLRSLEKAGIPRAWLLEMLFEYAAPKRRQSEQQLSREVALRSIRKIDAVLRVLGKAAAELDNFSKETNIPCWVKDPKEGQHRKLRERLAIYSVSLQEVRLENTKLASNKGELVSEELLAVMVIAIEALTDRPHWSDLAYLIEAAHAAHDRWLQVDTDYVRKRFKRFNTNFPRRCLAWYECNWRGYFGVDRAPTFLSSPLFRNSLPWSPGWLEGEEQEEETSLAERL